MVRHVYECDNSPSIHTDPDVQVVLAWIPFRCIRVMAHERVVQHDLVRCDMTSSVVDTGLVPGLEVCKKTLCRSRLHSYNVGISKCVTNSPCVTESHHPNCEVRSGTLVSQTAWHRAWSANSQETCPKHANVQNTKCKKPGTFHMCTKCEHTNIELYI